MIIVSMGLNASATPINDVDIDILDFYESENMHYFDYIPEELIKKYKETIELADLYLSKLYGENAMLSTDDNFTLDLYCKGISLGLYLDLEDKDIKADLRSFTNDAAQFYIDHHAISVLSKDVHLTIESTEPYVSDNGSVTPMLDAGKYKVSGAVAYARKWTEEGKKLTNPNYNRYDSDCTNFISQVLAENGVAQVQSPVKTIHHGIMSGV